MGALLPHIATDRFTIAQIGLSAEGRLVTLRWLGFVVQLSLCRETRR